MYRISAPAVRLLGLRKMHLKPLPNQNQIENKIEEEKSRLCSLALSSKSVQSDRARENFKWKPESHCPNSVFSKNNEARWKY